MVGTASTCLCLHPDTFPDLDLNVCFTLSDVNSALLNLCCVACSQSTADDCASINQLLLGSGTTYYRDLHFKQLTLGRICLANVFVLLNLFLFCLSSAQLWWWCLKWPQASRRHASHYSTSTCQGGKVNQFIRQ